MSSHTKANTTVLTTDGSHTAFNTAYNETYHSRHGAVTESRHVYLKASGVAERLQNGEPVRVLEIGLGLGLNFLLSADLAIRCGAALHYYAYELALPAVSRIEAMGYDRFVSDEALYPAFVEHLKRRRPDSEQGVQLHPLITLTISPGNAACAAIPTGSADAVYLDAFSPDNNPECWESDFLCRLAQSLVTGGRLSTYCSKGCVRRALTASGLRVEKLPGPPGKREILVGVRI